jgi:hypothetical protein
MELKSLDYWLDTMCGHLRAAAEGQDTFYPTVIVIKAGEVSNHLLLPGEADDLTAKEQLPRFYDFGVRLFGEVKAPVFIIVADILMIDDRRGVMAVHGCSEKLESGRRGFFVELDRKRKFRAKESTQIADPNNEYDPATEVFKGYRSCERR